METVEEEAIEILPTPAEELIAESSSENEELETVEEEAIEGVLPTPAEEPLAESNSENEELETVEEEAIEILPTPAEEPLEDKGVIFKADSETSKVENVDFEKLKQLI